MEESTAKKFTRILSVYLKIANIVGLCPLQQQEGKTGKIFLIRWIPLICSHIIAYSMRLSLAGHETNLSNLFNNIDLAIVTALEVIAGFITSIITSTIPLKSSQWQVFLKLAKEDQAQPDISGIDKWRFIYKTLGVHLLGFLIHAYLIYCWFFSTEYGLPIVSATLMSISVTIRWYHHFIMINLIWELADILKTRYNYLKIKIVDNFKPWKPNRNILNLRIREIKSTYITLNELTTNANQIFGLPSFAMLCYNVIALLNVVIWAIHLEENHVLPITRRYWIQISVGPLFFMVHTAFLVIACDKIEQTGKGVIKACYLLQDRIDKSDGGDELTYLIQFLRGLAPEFSAAGLFIVNRKLLSTLFSLITTHIIVLLQFRK